MTYQNLRQTASDWSDWVGIMVTTTFGLVSGLPGLSGPQKGPVLAPKGPLGAPEGLGGPDLVPTAADWSDWVGIMVTTLWSCIEPLLGPQGHQKSPVLALNDPFGVPEVLGGSGGANEKTL